MSNAILIIEQMDFQSMENKIIVETIMDKQVKNYWLNGPHAEGGIVNGNGRTYPVPVVAKEVKRLNEKEIPNNRMLGELSHPNCHSESAKILTEDGWKFLKDISDIEKVYTLNVETDEIELHQITKKIEQNYQGKMVNIKSRSINTLVTPNHRFPIVTRYGKAEFVIAQELFDNPTKYSHSYIPKLGNWNADCEDVFILKGLSDIPKKGNYNINPEIDSSIDMLTFVRFLGMWLAEGFVIDNNKQGFGYKCQVGISQKDEETKQEIRDLLKTFPPEMKWVEYTNKKECTTFMLRDLRLAEYLKNNFGYNCYTKKISKYFKNLPAEYLSEMLLWFQKGDGRNRWMSQECGTYHNQNIFSVSEKLIEDFCEIQLKCGGSGNITKIICNADYYFADHLIKAENKVPLYQLNFSTTKGIHLDKRFIVVEEIDFDGNVYCVSVPNHNFYCMDNGKTFWSGNSIDINYERVSHLTKELRMESNIAFGRSLVLDTPMGKITKSLMDVGVKICTSTRGLGTLRESIVQNDWRWKCNDLVHDPSAPSAVLDAICENRLEWVLEDGLLTEKEIKETVAEVNKVIIEHQFSVEDRQAAFLKIFTDVLTNIKKK